MATIQARHHAVETVERGIVANISITITPKPGTVARFGQEDVAATIARASSLDVSWNTRTDTFVFANSHLEEYYDMVVTLGTYEYDGGEVCQLSRRESRGLLPA